MSTELDYIPKDELAALTAIARDGGERVRDSLYHYAQLRARKARKGRKDHTQDLGRRILVGARLPREEAWMISRAANLQGVSLYRFCRDALTEKAHEITQFSTTNGPFVEATARGALPPRPPAGGCGPPSPKGE